MGENFTFQIVSKKHRTFTVIAPERFRAEIGAHTWGVQFDKRRAPGSQFVVATGTWVNKRTVTLLLHRKIWTLSGRPETALIDHRDGQPLNNSEDNLRAATPAQNQLNRKTMSRRNTTGARGVYLIWRGTWIARIGPTHIGTYLTFGQALEARNAFVKKMMLEEFYQIT